MSTTLYKKVGRRYVPVAESEYDFRSTYLPLGHYLLSVQPGAISRTPINPKYAEWAAAAQVAKEAMVDAMMKKNTPNEPRMTGIPEHLRSTYQRAWDAWVRELGEEQPLSFNGVSMMDIVEAGIKAVIAAKDHSD